MLTPDPRRRPKVGEQGPADKSDFNYSREEVRAEACDTTVAVVVRVDVDAHMMLAEVAQCGEDAARLTILTSQTIQSMKFEDNLVEEGQDARLGRAQDVPLGALDVHLEYGARALGDPRDGGQTA